MAESIVVPIEGQHVTPQAQAPTQTPERPESGFRNGVYVPPTGRQSLHRVRMGAGRNAEQVETAPQWVDNPSGTGGRFEYRPVQRVEPETSSPPPQSTLANDAVIQHINQLTGAVGLMLRDQYGIQPQPQGPQIPNPDDYDPYDPQQQAAYNQKAQEYIDALVEQRLQARLAPYQETLAQADRKKEYNDCVKEFGEDPKFQATMNLALMECQEAENNGKHVAIRDAFMAINNPAGARPGRRSAHLPEAFSGRGKKIGQISLRDIVIHNQMTGRSGR